MAFTYNSAGKVQNTSSSTTITIPYTAGTNSKLCVLTISCYTNGVTGRGGSAPTYNGSAMTQCGSVQTSAEGFTEMWYWLDPDDGVSRDVVIDNPSGYAIRYTVSDYTNASYDAAFTNSGGGAGDAANVPASVTSAADGSVCVSCMVHGEKDQFASITGGTSLLPTPSIDEGSTQTGAAYSIKSGAGTESHTYVSGGSSDDYNWVMGTWEETSAPVIEALAGQSDITVTVTGALSVTKTIAGQSDSTISVTGSLGISQSIAGQSDVGISVSGAISLTKTIAGQSNVAVSTSGVMSKSIGLQGQADVAISTTGDLEISGGVTLAGQSDVAVAVTGSLGVSRSIAGQANVVSTSSGDVSLLTNYSREASSAPAANDATLANLFTSGEYTQVETDDADRVSQVANTGQYPTFLFKDANPTQQSFRCEWNGQASIAPFESTVYLQIYNQNTTAWETMAINETANADEDFTLVGAMGSSLSDYYNENNQIACRVYQQVTA